MQLKSGLSGFFFEDQITKMNFPEGFLKSISSCTGYREEEFLKGHELPSSVSVRLNPLKKIHQFNTCEPVAWCDGAYYLQERPEFIFDPLLHAGCYYVQEASSMFLHHAISSIVDLSTGQTALDLCAAPGGKSTLIASLLDNNSLLVANEVIKPRASILLENISKWNSFNTLVCNNDPEKFSSLNGIFDFIVTDVPCSGSGLFRKDAAALKEWSEDNVKLCAARQKRILADVLPSLKTEGYLFYSTCSYSEEENEEVLDWLCENFEMESVSLPLKPEWGITESQSKDHKAHGYRFYPGKVKGEGFFMGVLRKKKTETSIRLQSKTRLEKPDNAQASLVKNLLISENEHMGFVKQKDELIIYNKRLEQELIFFREKLNVLSFGTRAGSIMRDELIPAHELAMTRLLNDTIDRVELNKTDAIKYLRRDEVRISGLGKGWKLVTHQNEALGWIKSLGNRINNYYPKEWRILKAYQG